MNELAVKSGYLGLLSDKDSSVLRRRERMEENSPYNWSVLIERFHQSVLLKCVNIVRSRPKKRTARRHKATIERLNMNNEPSL